MYMSYCRMEGTLRELRACFQDVVEHINEEAEYSVSDREIDCFRTIVEEMVDFLNETELLREDGELDDVVLDCICKSMKEGYME